MSIPSSISRFLTKEPTGSSESAEISAMFPPDLFIAIAILPPEPPTSLANDSANLIFDPDGWG